MKALDINPYKAHLDDIYHFFSNTIWSKKEASRCVGGPGTLEKLIAEGKIEADKPCPKQNGKWRVNAADALRYCKVKRKDKRQN